MSLYPLAYPSILKPLLEQVPATDLGPGVSNPESKKILTSLKPETVVPNATDRELAQACLSGLWLLHNFLDESHQISQELSSSTGSFWHAIMHRREPDPGNSKYWWRRVGSHPVLKSLVQESPSVGYNYINPFDFVDYCERVRGSGSPEETIAQEVQLLEWKLLFDWCFTEAKG